MCVSVLHPCIQSPHYLFDKPHLRRLVLKIKNQIKPHFKRLVPLNKKNQIKPHFRRLVPLNKKNQIKPHFRRLVPLKSFQVKRESRSERGTHNRLQSPVTTIAWHVGTQTRQNQPSILNGGALFIFIFNLSGFSEQKH